MSRTNSAARSKFRSPIFEPLEDRRLMSVTLGANLIVNPGAESNTGTSTGNTVITPSGWTANSTPTVVKYGASGGFPTTSSPGAPSRGANFFAGGPNNSESDLFQTIDLSSIASTIDAGKIKFALSAYLGGLLAKTDNASVFVNFQDSTHGFVNQTSIGPVTAANRGNTTEMLLNSLNGTVPATTRFAQVQIHFEGSSGYDDGFADNLSFVLTSTATTTGTVSGTVLNDTNGDGVKSTGEVGLGGVKVFFDTNGNGIQDPSETKFTTTASNGTYSFTGVTAGTYKIGEVVPSTYRSSGLNPASVTVTAGGTVAANFFDSQTALISGTIFGDTNGNKVQDATEKGLAGVVVYLDFNNNGQLDSFELKTTTDSSGHYKFVVPFGTYVVREVVPTGKIQTTPVSSFTHTLAKGGVSTTDKFGDK